MQPTLTDVPETMLWTLHNRASEAKRSDGILHDPDSVRIYDSLDYDYERSFGAAEPSHALRSLLFDEHIRRFLADHPDGVIVNLGEGLETQRFRVTKPEALWFSVDVPKAIEIRERFIEADAHHRHIARSALDRAWFDEIPSDRPVFVTAQGLLMYFKEDQVQSLIADLAARFAGGQLMFDAIPHWLSRRTLSEAGWQKTPHYTTPPMPWGIGRNEMDSTFRRWAPSITEVQIVLWPAFPRGFAGRFAFPVLERTPYLSRFAPSVTKVLFGPNQ